MKGSHLWFKVVALLAAVAVLGVTALAQESKEPQEKPTAEKPEAQAEKPAPEKPAPEKPAPKKPAPEKPEKEEPSLEKRLVALQKALEEFMAKRRNLVPRHIDSLWRALPDKKAGIRNPETGKRILINPALKGKYIRRVRKPKRLITFYADKATPKKGTAVIFADGTQKYLKAKALKAALKGYIPPTLDRRDMAAERAGSMGEKSGPRGR